MAIQQWLAFDSHVVGPRELGTMQALAKVTNDKKLLDSCDDYFNACRSIRAQRGEILKLISIAINDKLSGNSPQQEGMLKVIYDNVEDLAEILELEEIAELDEPKTVSTNIINRPLDY